MNQGTDRLTGHDLLEVAGNIHVEHIDGQVILLTHGSCGKVHDLEVTVVYLIKCDLVKLGGCGILLGIGSVDAVHAGTLEHYIGFNLYAAQG